MMSADWIVDSLCATAIVLRPFAALSRAACTTFSDSESSADVASSSSRTVAEADQPLSRWAHHAVQPLLTFRIPDQRSSDSDALLLTARQLCTLASDLGVVAIRKRHDKVVDTAEDMSVP